MCLVEVKAKLAKIGHTLIEPFAGVPVPETYPTNSFTEFATKVSELGLTQVYANTWVWRDVPYDENTVHTQTYYHAPIPVDYGGFVFFKDILTPEQRTVLESLNETNTNLSRYWGRSSQLDTFRCLELWNFYTDRENEEELRICDFIDIRTDAYSGYYACLKAQRNLFKLPKQIKSQISLNGLTLKYGEQVFIRRAANLLG